MKFTAIFMDIAGNYLTKYFVTHHDKSRAWEDILSQTAEGRAASIDCAGRTY